MQGPITVTLQITALFVCVWGGGQGGGGDGVGIVPGWLLKG